MARSSGQGNQVLGNKSGGTSHENQLPELLLPLVTILHLRGHLWFRQFCVILCTHTDCATHTVFGYRPAIFLYLAVASQNIGRQGFCCPMPALPPVKYEGNCSDKSECRDCDPYSDSGFGTTAQR